MKEERLQLLEERYRGYGLPLVEEHVMELIEEIRKLQHMDEVVTWEEKMNDPFGNSLYLLMKDEQLYYYGQEKGELIFGNRIQGAAEFTEDDAVKFTELFLIMGAKVCMTKKEVCYREMERIEKEKPTRKNKEE